MTLDLIDNLINVTFRKHVVRGEDPHSQVAVFHLGLNVYGWLWTGYRLVCN